MLSRLCLVAFVVLLLTSTALARSAPPEAGQARSFPVPPIRARAAVVLDAANGHVLAALNPHLRLPIASTTKIMTALLALKMGRLTDRVVVPRSAFNYESDATAMGLHPGQTVTLKDLLYGLMLPSGADAANTIAIHYAGSEARFVALMNREAGLLNMRDTHYVNTHGLTASGEYSSAYDLALLSQDVSYMPDLMKIASARSYRWNGQILTNLNYVLFWYLNADGIKPGYTNEAGFCQVLDARRNGRHIIVVLLHTPDLVIDARDLLNFGLSDFSWAQSKLPVDSPYLVYQGTGYLYFIGSGHYLRGQLLSAYTAYGGLAGLGFPRTEALREGNAEVQYFQNGVLSLGPAANHVTRLALGLTPLPTPLPTSTPKTPTPAQTPEGSITPPYAADARVSAVRALKSGATPTPTPLPHVTGTPTPTAQKPPSTAQIFAAFQRSHTTLLGSAATGVQRIHGYPVQIFAYGALAYDAKSHAVYLLPLGDRLLAARHFLPTHPGNAYPSGFAPVALLKILGWPPYTSLPTAKKHA